MGASLASWSVPATATRHAGALGRRAGFAISLLAAAFVAVGPGRENASADEPPQRYVPVEADFRKVYDADAANRRNQTWDDYWSWVRQFYEGNLFSQGWTRQSETLTAKVRDAGAKNKLRASLDDLGRIVAGEWSKDNSVRRINTNDLSSYGQRLQNAAKRDDGTGQAIRTEMDAIRKVVDQRLKR
jgi:hypothetical protein